MRVVNWGLATKSADRGCGLFARMFFQIAFSLINYQCQNGRQYPSRFSLRMLQYSADHGHVRAMAQLGTLLYQCGVGRADKRSGIEYLRLAAKGGDIEAQYQLGAAYLQGQLVRQDNKSAIHWLALAADRGHDDACELLHSMKADTPNPKSSERAFA